MKEIKLTEEEMKRVIDCARDAMMEEAIASAEISMKEQDTCNCTAFNEDIIDTSECTLHGGGILNTPDTEWETQDAILQDFKDKYPLPSIGYDGSEQDFKERKIQYCLVKELIYRAVVSGKKSLKHLLSSRDTHWKERVRKEVEGMRRKEAHPPIPEIRGDSWRMGYNQALDTLLENLNKGE